jgi:phosphopantothenoylcysteine decarboxylase/phosphopantothenate--cysteine ligase
MKVCFGICGSIASYRSPELIKRLVAQKHEVRAILTQSAEEFVTPKVLETFSNQPVTSHDSFDSSHFATDHISLARWADVFVVYGATANFLAKQAHGFGDDALSLQLLAFKGRVVVAPAMNPAMWEHPAVEQNVSTLRGRGIQFVGPIEGTVACGETGFGHVATDEEILAAIFGSERTSVTSSRDVPPSILSRKKILISAGPMRTAVDPVRFVQNRSSGKMGYELAREAQAGGAFVTVLLGPVNPSMEAAYRAIPGAEIIRYESPTDYSSKLLALADGFDFFFSAAAVLDFDVEANDRKLERSELSKGDLRLSINPVQDWVSAVAHAKKPHQRVIAFAAEFGTDAEILERAKKKLVAKKADLLIANPVRPSLGPDADQNEIWILRPSGETLHFGPAQKSLVAKEILKHIP